MFEINTDRDQLLVSMLETRFPGAILHHEVAVDIFCITLWNDKIDEILEFLYKKEELQYTFLTSLCGMHYPDDALQLGLVYHLHSMVNRHRIRLKTATSLENPHFPTATNIFAAANWMERETFDFFGIIFDGHPNLVRILNVDDFEGFPLRKDFRLEDQTREDKNDAMFGR
ncbi:MAG: NADH-quinone oxidoreductase subunit C [Bacteroidota bacterium]